MKERTLLILALVVSLLAGGCMDEAFDQSMEPSYKLSTLEQATFDKINAYRDSLGLPTLLFAEVIFNQTRKHALDMAEGRNSLNHDGFNERLAAIREVIPFRVAGENIGYNGQPDPIDHMLEKWLQSEVHRKNIQNEVYTHTGIGIARSDNGVFFFTQIFIEEK